MSVDIADVLIVGAGLAGSRCAEALRAGGFDGRILLAGDEPHAPYERPALSKEALVEGRDASKLSLHDAAFWGEQQIELRTGTEVTDLDLSGHTARLNGEPVQWKHLVLATGARARVLPGLVEAAGVHRLRSLDDAERLREELVPGSRLVVIGAGFVGCEVASSARGLGVEVTILEAAPMPLVGIVGAAVAERIADRIRGGGVDLRLAFSVASIDVTDGRVSAVVANDGTRVECDLLLVAVGAQPNAEIVRGLLELAPDSGIPTSGAGRTEAVDVYACGDVASPWREAIGRNQRLEHWTSADHGARAVAASILGKAPAPAGPAYFWSDQFGCRLQMVGHGGPDLDVTLDEDADGLVARYSDPSGELVAGLVINRPRELGALRRSLAKV